MESHKYSVYVQAVDVVDMNFHALLVIHTPSLSRKHDVELTGAAHATVQFGLARMSKQLGRTLRFEGIFSDEAIGEIELESQKKYARHEVDLRVPS